MVMPRSLDSEQRERALRLIRENRMTQAEIARDLGVHQTMISRIALQAGVRRKDPISQTKVDKIRQMYLDGYKIKDIAEDQLVSLSMVNKLIYNKRRYSRDYQDKLDLFRLNK